MEQILDVLGVVEGRRVGRGLGDLLAIGRLSRVDPTEDQKLAKIGQTDLELLDSLTSCDEVFGLAGLSFFLSFPMLAFNRISCRYDSTE